MGLSNGTGGGGEFLTPADHKNAKAVLIEAKRILRDQAGKFGKRDILVADVTVFRTLDELNGELPPLEIQSAKITGSKIVEDFEDKVGGDGTVCRFVALPNSKGPHPIWVTRSVDQAAFERVAAFVEKRDADLAAAMDEEEPEWMK